LRVSYDISVRDRNEEAAIAVAWAGITVRKDWYLS